MDILALIPSVDNLLSILYVALGLSLVIFFHELGHFAVAKWCDVFVERFSIGMGPILISRKWGETEYALSAIPFGGYVKMLGQDDMDPSQMTSEQIAEDPRAYTAKKVWQRMAIISAGVIMNIVTAMIFFGIAYLMGVNQVTSDLGTTMVGKPAWEAGIEPGDCIVKINGKPVVSYEQVMLGVALSSGELEIGLLKHDGTEQTFKILPAQTELRRQIGVTPGQGLTLLDFKRGTEQIPFVLEGFPAATAEPPFEPGDTVKRINDTTIESSKQLTDAEARLASEELTYYVQRKPAEPDQPPSEELIPVKVAPIRFLELGIITDIGPIKFIRPGSPAEAAGLQAGDKIMKVNGQAVGEVLNAFKLPDLFSNLQGQEVTLEIRREGKKRDPERVPGLLEIKVTPDERTAWSEPPLTPETPLSVPSLGLAFEVTRTVQMVKPGGPAADLVEAGDRIQKIEFIPRDPEKAAKLTDEEKRNLTLEFADSENKDKPSDLSYAFWAMQFSREHDVKLTLNRNKEKVEVTLTPAPDEQEPWYFPERGLRLQRNMTLVQASSVGQATSMGVNQAFTKIMEIYYTLRSLFTGDLSFKNFHGPIGIAKTAYEVAQSGFIDLLMFLGLLSINLAVLNFLPIPVLDGGHMVFLIWEAVTGKKPSEKVLAGATYVGVLFILGLIVMVMYLDIFYHPSR